MEAGRRFHDLAAAAGNERHSSDRNPDPVFSIPRFGIGKSLITGSRRDFRDSGIRDSSVLNPGIKKTGTGLQALDYTNSPLYQVSIMSRIRKVNCLHCTFGSDCCDAINGI